MGFIKNLPRLSSHWCMGYRLYLRCHLTVCNLIWNQIKTLLSSKKYKQNDIAELNKKKNKICDLFRLSKLNQNKIL